MNDRRHYAKSYELRAFHALMLRNESESTHWLDLLEDEAAHGGYSDSELETYEKLFKVSKDMSEVDMSLKSLADETNLSPGTHLSNVYRQIYETMQRGHQKYHQSQKK